MAIESHQSGSISIIDKQRSEATRFQIASRGDNMLSKGIAVLYMFLNLLSKMVNTQYQTIQDKFDLTSEAINRINRKDVQSIKNMPLKQSRLSCCNELWF